MASGDMTVRTLPVLYRYETSGSHTSQVGLFCDQFRAIRETPKGWWIEYWGDKGQARKWVAKTGRKRFAYPTKELALESFVARKQHMIAKLEYTLGTTKTALELAKQIQAGEKTDNDSLPNPGFTLGYALAWE